MAGRIPEQFIDEVRNSVDIVDVISQYVSLEKKGKDYLGLCPFHQEKTPSFTVNEGKQFFKCFGCGKGGNVFKFLMYQDHLTFPESVRKVAELAHLHMPEGYGKTVKPLSPLKKMYRQATEFYQHILLTTKVGERALEYAQKRELTSDLLEHFKVGYAPDNDAILLTYLRQEGYTDDELRESGLFVESQDGQLFDRFRDRLMFPLGDESGYTVGFSGRRISNDKTIAKYMNSPETKIFNKSKLLFHFAEAKKAARSEKHLILYEGYMDVIAAWQAGVQLGVASMGTSLTPEQIQKLRHVTDTILIAYDGDRAGLEATNRAIEMIQSTNAFTIGIIPFDNGLDPDEFIKQRGPQAFIDLVEHGQETIYQFKKRFLSKKYQIQVESQKIQYIEEMIIELAKLTNDVEKNLAMKSLADEFNLDYTTIQNQVKQKQLQTSQNFQAPPVPSVETQAPVMNRLFIKNEGIQRHLMYRLIHHNEAWTYLNRINPEFSFPDALYEQLFLHIQAFRNEEEEFDVQEFMLFLNDKDFMNRNLVSEIELGQFPPECTEQEIQDLVYVLSQKNTLKEQLAQKKEELNRAALMNDDETRKKLMVEIMEIQRQLRKR